MTIEFKARASDSPHVHQVACASASADSTLLVVPDGSWGLIVSRNERQTRVFLTGSTTRPLKVCLSAGEEILSVSFKASAYSPAFSAQTLLDSALPLPTATNRSIWWSGQQRIELPTFENADDFVAELLKREQLAVNAAVAAVLAGHAPAMSPRTLQRHFLKTTGMTHNYWQQIQRAQQAVSSLKRGKSLAQVAFESGYVDQAHMTRWLKQIVGRTPGVIAREDDAQ
jgi:AraC-like DNA-binding protein